MGKNVLVVSASLRPTSNSHALALAFAEGAREAGHDVETAGSYTHLTLPTTSRV